MIFFLHPIGRWASCLGVVASLGVALPASASETLPLHRGFPIYPPEAIEGVAPGALKLETSLRTREADLARLQAVRTPEGLSGFDVGAEAASLERALRARAEKEGWILLREDDFSDGGSRQLAFGRKEADGFSRATVFIGMPMVGLMRGGRGGTDTSSYGRVTYTFAHFPPAAVVVAGLPLCLSGKRVEAPARGADPEVVTVRCSRDGEAGRVEDDDAILPRLAGWREHRTPMLDASTHLYLNEGKAVRVKTRWRGRYREITATIYRGAAVGEVLAAFPTTPDLTVRVGRGLLLIPGGVVSPPIVLHYDGRRVLAEDTRLLAVGRRNTLDERRRVRQQMDKAIEALWETRLVVTTSFGFRVSSKRFSAQELDVLAREISKLARRPASDPARRDHLREAIGIRNLSDADADALLSRSSVGAKE